MTTYTVTEGITKGWLYHFKVLAINAVGESPVSESLTSLAAVVPS